MKKIPHLMLDMDGVIANFHAEAIRAHLRQGPVTVCHGTFHNPEDAYELASNDRWPIGQSLMKYLGVEDLDAFWKPINSDPLFWRGIPPYVWWRDLIKICDYYTDELIICTSPSSHHHSWAGKALWLQQRSLHDYPTIMMNHASNGGPRGKSVGKWLYAGPGRVLIDDWQKQTDPFIKVGGQAILFPQPWNSNHPNMSDPVGYVRDQLQLLTE